MFDEDLIGPILRALDEAPAESEIIGTPHPSDLRQPWIGRDTYRIYWAIGRAFQPETMLEIGVRFGYSIASMARGGGSLKSVHGFDNESDFFQSLKHAGERLTPLIANLCLVKINSQVVTSIDIPPVDIAHVDGLHTYAGVRHDCQLAYNALRPGGILLIDDVGGESDKDVRWGADRFCAENGLIPQYLPCHTGMYVVRKTPMKPVAATSSAETQTMTIGGIAHERNRETGFIHQLDAQPFEYTSDYCDHQSTTAEMSYLRLGIIEREMGFEALTAARVLELGPGRGVMKEIMQRHCLSVDGYDIAPTPHVTVAADEAKKRHWDLLIACDVIEHFPRIDDLWTYDFDWAYISIPCRPEAIDWNEIAGWRHFRPNEHLWHIAPGEFKEWANKHGYEVRFAGHTEDLIRARWDRTKPNISNFVIRRK